MLCHEHAPILLLQYQLSVTTYQIPSKRTGQQSNVSFAASKVLSIYNSPTENHYHFRLVAQMPTGLAIEIPAGEQLVLSSALAAGLLAGHRDDNQPWLFRVAEPNTLAKRKRLKKKSGSETSSNNWTILLHKTPLWP